MHRIVKNLPDSAEFLIVMFVCFGTSTAVSLWYYFVQPELIGGNDLDDLDALTLVFSELIALGATLLFLEVRGWRLEVFRPRFGGKSTLAALGIFLVVLLFNIYVQQMFLSVADRGDGQAFSHDATFFGAAAVSLVNPVFEELIVVGYVMNFVGSRFGGLTAVLASAGIRTLYHLYQGPAAFLTILPMGVFFGLIYWRWRNLWPLILAHAGFNFLSFVVSR